MVSHVSHPYIVPEMIEEREYQSCLAVGCLRQSTLLILPTGLGKTVVALRVIADILAKGSKVLILAPTKPLVDQHFSFFTSSVSNASVGVMNGNMDPSKRGAVIKENDITISTPQAVANDLKLGRYDLSGIGLIIYDEAHRGVGNYAYVTVAEHYDRSRLSLGMTASPGSQREKLDEICCNLLLTRIDMRSEDDPDVSPYTYNVEINRVEVEMPEDIVKVTGNLRSMLEHYVQELINLRAYNPGIPISTKQLLSVARTLQFRLESGEKTATVFRCLTVQSMAVKLNHAIGLAETQGMSSIRLYINKLKAESEQSKGGKGAKELMGRKEMKNIITILSTTRVEHPKISRVMSFVSKELNSNPGSKVMVFSHYRSTCELLTEKLSSVPGASVGKLIGQSAGGLKQKEQTEILRKFRSGEYNVIVATSVGEEGLDVASTDLLIFYENVPSEIRTIQRRGRTGRKNDGRIYMLTTKGTRDEAFENVSRKKEELMMSRLRKLRSSIQANPTPRAVQKGIIDFK